MEDHFGCDILMNTQLHEQCDSCISCSLGEWKENTGPVEWKENSISGEWKEYSGSGFIFHHFKTKSQDNEISFPRPAWLMNIASIQKVHAKDTMATVSNEENNTYWNKMYRHISKTFFLYPHGLFKLLSIQKVHAEENSESTETKTENGNKLFVFPPEVQALAMAYIAQENGMERVRRVFKEQQYENVERQSELLLMEMGIGYTFLLGFIVRYIPAFKEAKIVFKQRNQVTVFETEIQAARRFLDNVAYSACYEAFVFATRITLFTAGTLFSSTMISAYRNKTSVSDWVMGTAFIGGLSRAYLGLGGVITGSVLGTVLGTILGGAVYLGKTTSEQTYEKQHMEDIMTDIVMAKSTVGNEEFKKKISELIETLGSK